MIKLNKLRKYITKQVHFLQVNPDKLHVFIDNGKIINTTAKSLSFEYEYTLNLIITDFSDPIDEIMIPIVSFMYVHQQEQFGNPDFRDDAITYEVEHLDNHKYDISINLKMTERVITKYEDGFLVKHMDDKPPVDFLPPWALSLCKTMI